MNEKNKNQNKFNHIADKAITEFVRLRTNLSPESEYIGGALGIILLACLLTESKTNFEFINVLVEKMDQTVEMMEAENLIDYILLGFSLLTLDGAYRLATDRYYLLKAIVKVHLLKQPATLLLPPTPNTLLQSNSDQ